MIVLASVMTLACIVLAIALILTRVTLQDSRRERDRLQKRLDHQLGRNMELVQLVNAVNRLIKGLDK